jgi:hypothetical protein
MKTQLNEIKRMQLLAGVINESQLEEALNKDIRQFGQDLDKRLKEAGFKTLVLVGQNLNPEAQKKLNNEQGLIALEVQRYNGSEGEVQQMYLYCNPKDYQKVKKVVDKFQLSNYEGQAKFNDKTWTTKTVIGAINPGDIVKIENENGSQIWFYRYEKVDRKLKTSTYGTPTSTTKTNTAQQKISEIDLDEVVDKALSKVRKK